MISTISTIIVIPPLIVSHSANVQNSYTHCYIRNEDCSRLRGTITAAFTCMINRDIEKREMKMRALRERECSAVQIQEDRRPIEQQTTGEEKKKVLQFICRRFLLQEGVLLFHYCAQSSKASGVIIYVL